jgi:hypothetical protein
MPSYTLTAGEQIVLDGDVLLTVLAATSDEVLFPLSLPPGSEGPELPGYGRGYGHSGYGLLSDGR